MTSHTSCAGAAITCSTVTGHLNPDLDSCIGIYAIRLGQYNADVRFSRKQSFKLLEKPCCDGLESAISGRQIRWTFEKADLERFCVSGFFFGVFARNILNGGRLHFLESPLLNKWREPRFQVFHRNGMEKTQSA